MSSGGVRRWVLRAAAALGLAIVAGPGGGLAAAEPVAPAATQSWLTSRIGRGIGPPGGEVRALAIAAGDPERLFAGTANGRLFVTDDGGGSWRESEALLPPTATVGRVVVDSRSPDVAYAVYWVPDGRGGLLQTRDGGDCWHPLDVPDRPPLRTVALSPSEPDILYVGGETGVWRSDDAGISWIGASGLSAPIREVESLAVDPRSPHRVISGTRQQAYRSPDGGISWALIGRGMPVDRHVFAIDRNPFSPNVLITGTCGFMYISHDGGDNWRARQRGVPFDHRRIQAVVTAPFGQREVWAGTRGGLYRSRDGADSFQLVRGGISVSAIALNPDTPRIYAATEELGILASSPGGEFAESNSGLDASRVVAFDVAPDGFQTVFAARTERPGVQSIQASSDAGRSWNQLGGDIRFADVRVVRALAHPAPQILVVGGDGAWWRVAPGGGLQSFAPPKGRVAAVAVAHHESVVLAATDAGLFLAEAGLPVPESTQHVSGPTAVWRTVATGALTALAVSGDQFLALGSELALRGSVTAVRAGTPPEAATQGRLAFDPVGVALAPGPASVAYAISRNGLWVNASGDAAGWTEAELPWRGHDFRAVTVDPSDPDRVVALDARGALFSGRDGGRHWRVLDDDPWLTGAQDFRLSGSHPGLALVATLGHGLRVVALDGLDATAIAEPAQAALGEVRPQPTTVAEAVAASQ